MFKNIVNLKKVKLQSTVVILENPIPLAYRAELSRAKIKLIAIIFASPAGVFIAGI